MSQGCVPLRTRALGVLVDAGTWVGRDELDALSTCRPAVDDTLADLVIEQVVEHRPHSGYRLAGTPAARRAAAMLRRTGKRLAVVGVPGADSYRLGVAEDRPEGLLLYELEIPNPEPGPQALQQHLAQVGRVLDYVNEKGGSVS